MSAASIDWRTSTHLPSALQGNYVTPVKDQGCCNSSVSHAICATVESLIMICNETPGGIVDLSEAALQFCGGGSCSGWTVDAALDYLKKNGCCAGCGTGCVPGGVPPESCMPYTAGTSCTDQVCSLCTDWQKKAVRIQNWFTLYTAYDRKYYLETRSPLIGAMYVDPAFYSFSGTGIFQSTPGAVSMGSMAHTVCIIGYKDPDAANPVGYWICKNSWGTGWGDNGFFKIAYGDASGIDSTFPFWFPGMSDDRCPVHNYRGSIAIYKGKYFDLDDGCCSSSASFTLAADHDIRHFWPSYMISGISGHNGALLVKYTGPKSFPGLTLQDLKPLFAPGAPTSTSISPLSVGDIIAVRTVVNGINKYTKIEVTGVGTYLTINFVNYYTPPYP